MENIPQDLPQDPYMLASFINMKLRDEYPSLNELCASLDVDMVWLKEQLALCGMEYSEELNKFW